MKNDDIHKLMRELQHPAVRLPLGRANLRKQLMTLHAVQRNVPPSARSIKTSLLHSRSVIASRHIMRLGLIIAAMFVILLSFLMFLPTAHNSSNRKFVTAALPTGLPKGQGLNVPSFANQQSATETRARSAGLAQSIVQPSVTPASSPPPSPALPANAAPPTSARPVTEANNAANRMGGPGVSKEHGGSQKDKVPNDKPDKNKAKATKP